jgi:hypothetical protein
MAFMGLPWPRNNTGIEGDGLSFSGTRRFAAFTSVVINNPGKVARVANEVLRCMMENSKNSGVT